VGGGGGILKMKNPPKFIVLKNYKDSKPRKNNFCGGGGVYIYNEKSPLIYCCTKLSRLDT